MPSNFFLNNFKIKISFLILLSIFLISSFASAALMVPDPPPIISDVSIEPNKVKINQAITIKAKVVGEENNDVSFAAAFFPELDILLNRFLLISKKN